MDESYWKIIDTDAKSPEDVYMEVEEMISECIAKPKQDEIEILWPVTSKTCDYI